ncbi:MAG: DNA-directed RNA polymerase subunit beta [Candidatus Chisholmbacteria bacterium RIFCSPHIGHO2_01_FULL_49_18]|uniref:DNA-directed RNA polymerase subunit beta n=2 Tax=Candidatus Chisholmiibacteriota TaxID=1817900 RepID=A0A1G1VLS6_9BACT|nr:MAG: DNA-directed RNA polymerase subunit beta [Candidatus Chisholmbacteria bacterium RIFCSPHIGHO2_01_FULL_49_18]OGY19365.1 MAG: DNA-directed RNA polymerase subunit beta [Candidatus Chisholmbacteria bacterium RIFCSPLOWO2_01_FULL_49_14]
MKKKDTQTRQYWGIEERQLPQLDLLAVQRESYEWFTTEGIRDSLRVISPIEDFTGKNWKLEFGNHNFGEPKHTPEQAKAKGITYEMPLKVEAKLTNLQTGQTSEQEVFFGDIPKMTQTGTFIINGIERAVVSQLVRSPGVFFSGEVDPSTGRMLYKAELRPLRGSWLEFQVTRNDIITVKIDRHRKFPVTVLLRGIETLTDENIMEYFGDIDKDPVHLYVQSTLDKDSTKTREEAIIEIYEKMRPGEPAVFENAQQYLHQLFFDSRRYDLAKVGRYKLNKRLGIKVPNDNTNFVLKKEDIIATIRYLIGLQNSQGKVDDIDHLANRRVRCVGELVATTAFRIGLLRLERSIREKMSLTKAEEKITSASLVNARPIIATISEFFRRNRLSTILDQTNPLSEIDNLRRLSVMGPGGVTRERASFSMRDINASQYARICPIRSPEGPNIGLVNYMALYAKVNDYGFLEAPYKKVEKVEKNGKIRMRMSNEVIYISADDEEDFYITHAEVETDSQGFITEEWVPVRYRGEFLEAPVEQVQLVDVVSRQVVGTSASLIPFIAHDEANRALMGTHMQCQAVPLLRPSSPVVGTGMEKDVIEAMERSIRAFHGGIVQNVDANQVEIRVNSNELRDMRRSAKENTREYLSIDSNKEIYHIQKFTRSAQSTCYSQRPLVKTGQRIQKGDLIIDGPCSDQGELALGQNLLIAYMSFDGLGYEDAIIISERLVREDVLTSIHINEYEAQVMDTKLGPEELTRDIPNVGDTDLRNLGEDGIVIVGSEVGPNDILVGKIAPKGETELTAEERLLRAIFGEKAREVRDTSLRMPHGEAGTIIEVKILDRDKGDELDPGVNKKVIVRIAQIRKVTVGDKLAGRHGNKGVISKIVPEEDMPYLKDGTPVDIIISPLSVLARMNLGQLLEAHLGWAGIRLGYKVAIPVFEKIPETTINKELEKAKLPISGKVQLHDGRTGEPFEEETVVGIGYILKLIHMIEDKTHARSTGPYSLVTQQPLGGKAQMGGQRLGEMEVWALEAHRAATTLQEMLTIKSDDVIGRAKAFEAIVKGTEIPEATVPESFKVLVKELQSLCLEVIPTEAVEEDVLEIPEENGQIIKDEGITTAEQAPKEPGKELVSVPDTQVDSLQPAGEGKQEINKNQTSKQEDQEQKDTKNNQAK